MTHTPPTSATEGTSAATDAAAADNTSRSTKPVEIVKGNLNDAQRAAIEQVVGHVAEAVERQKNVKPHSRGHFGTPGKQRAENTANPTGFRTSQLP